jgi:hypothetical protein
MLVRKWNEGDEMEETYRMNRDGESIRGKATWEPRSRRKNNTKTDIEEIEYKDVD